MVNNYFGSLPPFDHEGEQVVLGGLLLEKECHDKVIPFIPDGTFYREPHECIFQAIKTLYGQNKSIDMITVSDQLRSVNKLEFIGGAYFLTTLTDKIASTSHIEEHVMILKEQWMKREVIRISNEAFKGAHKQTEDVFDTLAGMKKNLDVIDQVIVQHKTSNSFSSLIDRVGVEMKNKYDQAVHGKVSGVPSGIQKLDDHTGGWQNGDLIILAGRPGMGKTAFSLFCAKQAAMKDFHPCFFSLEMSDVSLVNRLILSETSIEPWRFRMGKLLDSDWQDFNHASQKMKPLPIHIFDTPSVNMNYIKAQARIMKRKEQCDIIIIDYLQLVEPEASKENREQQVSKMSRAAKGLARELEVPVILLSQLSRALETRGGDKKPMLSDLRDSGAIEQDADMVIFPHRPNYYGIQDSTGESLEGLGEFIIAKGRNTGTAEIPFRHDRAITNFWDLATDNTTMSANDNFLRNN